MNGEILEYHPALPGHGDAGLSARYLYVEGLPGEKTCWTWREVLKRMIFLVSGIDPKREHGIEGISESHAHH